MHSYDNSFGVIWDMDGVLVDTGPFHFQVWKDVLAGYDITLSPEYFRKTFGMNNDGFLRLILGERFNQEFAEKISKEKEAKLRWTIRGHIKPFPGVIQLLEELKIRSIPQALASSAPLANIKAVLVEMALEKSFQATVSAEYMPGKPDPAVFLEASRLLELAPDDCVVIEDSISGVQAALNAGMRCLAVANTNSIDQLTVANKFVTSLTEVTYTDLLNL